MSLKRTEKNDYRAQDCEDKKSEPGAAGESILYKTFPEGT